MQLLLRKYVRNVYFWSKKLLQGDKKTSLGYLCLLQIKSDCANVLLTTDDDS